MSPSDKLNTGALFKNDRRQKESHPHLTGRLLVQCPCCNAASEFYLNAWTNESETVGKWLNLSLKPKDAPRHTNTTQQPQADLPQGPDSETDDPIPFY